MHSKEIGLFLAKYRIGAGMPGAPTLDLSVAVNSVHQTIHGIGEIKQAVNPPVDVHTRVDGTYIEMRIMDSASVLIEAMGIPPVHWPDRRMPQGSGPAIMPNLFLRMVLQGWERGTAYYRYKNAEGEWVHVRDVPVEMIDLSAAKAS